MEFVLDKGTTSDTDFSEVNFVDVYAGGNLDFTISSSNNSFQLVFKGKSTNRVSCPKK